MKGFSSFEAWHFHNTPYGWLFRDYDNYERIKIEDLLTQWTPHHPRCLGGGDLVTIWILAPSWDSGRTGLFGYKIFKDTGPYPVWLNPEPQRYWNLVQTIREVIGHR